MTISDARVRARRLVRVALVTLAAVVVIWLAWLVMAVRLVVFPRYDEVGPADAIVILGPVDPWRQELAEQLVDEGLADVVMMSAWSEGFSEPYCHWARRDVETICYTPDPSTTRGEAKRVKEEIAARGWHRVIVITVDVHVERARYIFGECIGDAATVMVTGQPPPNAGWDFYTHHLLYQSGGFLKAVFVTPGC